MELTIYHQREKNRFATIVKGHEAFMKYNKPDANVLEITSTYIPSELRGQGIGSQIAEFACHYASSKQLKLKASCPYLAQFIENNPQIYQIVSAA